MKQQYSGWRKSNYSNPDTECVEVAAVPTLVNLSQLADAPGGLNEQVGS